tara:strand:+ start:1351 stop:2427 length:1077 start_codon:yes stop_codon:yes gene_type:complete
MKVCIIGDGLISLSLAAVLAKKKLRIEILSNWKSNKYDKSRTLGISKSNVDYFNKNIININKILWPVNHIRIFTEKNNKKEILSFNDNNKQIFSILKNHELQKLLIDKLIQNKFITFKKFISHEKIINQDYKLIINCNSGNEISTKFFSNKFEKNYDSFAYTAIINHKKKVKNNTAFQNFTNKGPIAFLPISNTKTSVVYSLRSKVKKKKIEIKDLIEQYNPSFSILKITNFNFFELKSSNLRNYFKSNILAFGELLHKIHPLAGQGFNMSLRDIRLLSDLIDEKINLGLEIDSAVCHEFQRKSQDKNYLFSFGIDMIYELFNFESKIKSNVLIKSINLIGKNKSLNSLLKKLANTGI